MHRAPTAFLASAAKRVASSSSTAAFAPRVSQSPLLIRSLLAHQQHASAMVATTSFRGFASKKDKGGKGGKGGKKNAKDDDDDEDSGSRKGKGKGAAASSGEMTFDLEDLEKKFSQCLERLKRDFTTMRAGTANPAILDPVMVKVEGKMVPLRDLAQVSIKDAKTLMVNINDVELSSSIEKAIREAGLNLNPIADNKAVRVPVPKPTKEFRESLTKLAATSTEKAKTIIRKLRQDGMKDLKKDLKAGMSEDENYQLEKKAQTLHDKYIKDAEEALKAKTKEIMAN
ncbi:ribosome recycling factor [Entomortierella parvispora]|uniref:Ribosome recycling factor n=1 Tax=Entomortierella parvispora TaxID=205924 RepID=A0A9P3H912_9FUNG|nr:ribosome recycling factor [Entomortierella parvispora]